MGRVPASPSLSKPTRPTHISPTKPSHTHLSTNATIKQPRTTRPPSTSTFNPFLPKTPGYPSHISNTNTYTNGAGVGAIPPTTGRIPRRHESMLSVNGSPLANPYERGLEWFEGGDGGSDDEDGEVEEREGER